MWAPKLDTLLRYGGGATDHGVHAGKECGGHLGGVRQEVQDGRLAEGPWGLINNYFLRI